MTLRNLPRAEKRIAGQLASVFLISLISAVLFVTAAVFTAVESVATEPELAGLINVAGSQRMLSQRIVLAYCKLGLGVSPKESRGQLQASIERFERQLAELKASAPSSAVRDALRSVSLIWKSFRNVAEETVSRDGARQLWNWDEDLLFASHKVVRLMQDLSQEQYARLVNISGRQRMLSQRLAKLYMLREWGFDTLTLHDDLDAARREFDNALELLQDSKENSPEISAELEKVTLQWVWFDSALDLVAEEPYRLVVSASSESVLLSMDKITAMYENLAVGQ